MTSSDPAVVRAAEGRLERPEDAAVFLSPELTPEESDEAIRGLLESKPYLARTTETRPIGPADQGPRRSGPELDLNNMRDYVEYVRNRKRK